MMIEEPVLIILAEGGSLKIVRKTENEQVSFIYHHNESDFSDEGLDVLVKNEYLTFAEAFQLINNYPWHRLYPKYIHPNYHEFVTQKLIKKMNEEGNRPTNMKHQLHRLEEALNIKLVFVESGNWAAEYPKDLT